jgi:starch-binding outer membrane protein, SusD/RagB family
LYDQPVTLGDDYKKARNTFEETVNFIVTDLDKAIGLYDVSEVGTIKTRADKGVAMAAKAKVLLYAASDLHNSGKNSVVTAGYAHPELVGYVGGDATARWTAAKAAAKAVIDLNKYSLYNANADKVRNFEEVFIKRSDEDIFLRYTDRVVDLYYALGRTPLWQGTPGYGGAGQNAVLGNLVDAFDMADGSKFDWNNGAQKADPYANRDPRIYASVLFEGTNWYPRPSTNDKVRVGKWADGSTAPDAQYTNYWLRKFIDVQKGQQAYQVNLINVRRGYGCVMPRFC